MVTPEMSFDNKAALSYWGMRLIRCAITPPRRKRYLLDILGADGAIDAMRGMGEPTYESRTITAVFQSTEYDPQNTVDRLLNELEGRTVPVVVPDTPNHYMMGEVHVSSGTYQPAGQITITAECLPWRYAKQEIVHNIQASTEVIQYTWRNAGTRLAVPEVTVSDADVTLTYNGENKLLIAGTYLMPDLAIPGRNTITVAVSGGAMTVRYREAIL